MRREKIPFSGFVALLLASLLMVSLFSAVAEAQSLQEQLKNLEDQVQQDPTDMTLRERIIKVARQMSPPPQIPPEARSHFDKGLTLQQNANDLDQLDLCINEFQQALLLAPWWPQAYNQLAAAYETAGDYDNAIINLKLYLLTHPGPADARDARARLADLGVVPEEPSASQTPEPSAAPAKADQYGYLLGPWQWGYYYSSYRGAGTGTGTRTGNLIQINSHIPGHERFLRGTIKSPGEITWEYWVGDYTGGSGFCARNYGWQPVVLQISPDQRVINFQYVYSPIGHCDMLATDIPIVYTLIRR